MNKNNSRRQSNQKDKINAKVKQGCPLFPFLLNLIVDELSEEIQKLNVGIDVNGKLLCCLAFADDLVLTTEERVHLQILIEHCK